EQYPLEPMSGRLAYEPRLTSGLDDATRAPAVELSPNVEARLMEFENGYPGIGGNTRRYMLTSLHNRTSDQFVLARGFGPVRMLSVRGERIELPDSGPVSLQPESEPTYEPEPESALPLADAGAFHLPRSALLSIHDSGLEDFFDPERVGYIQ